MKPEFPKTDQNGIVPRQAQEIEFALLISKMINTVKEDPTQMRLAIYEFARARLQTDTTWAEEPERTRLSAALETAIEGVEKFSAREDENERLQPPSPSVLIGTGSPAEPPHTMVVPLHQVNAAPIGTRVPREGYSRSEAAPVLEIRMPVPVFRRAGLWIGLLLFGVTVGLGGYSQRTFLLQAAGMASPSASTAELTVAKPEAPPSNPDPPLSAARADDARTTAAAAGSLPFPLPGDYGVYALNDATLSELSALPEQVPDKRIAMSTPISQPSRTTVPDGKAKFVVFRRDLAGDALERMDVRVVARVTRAVTFDAKGKPSIVPVSDAWNIRNISYEFRVRPVPGNPEMLLVQSAAPDFTLPAGRYVLVLKNQGYDFTVAGKVTDPSQCLERTDAANGAFYSGCQKQ